MPTKALLILLLCRPLVLCCVQDPDKICQEIVAWDSENDRLYTEKIAAYYDADLENDIEGTNETETWYGQKWQEFSTYQDKATNKSDCFLQYRDLIEKCHNASLFKVLDFFKTTTTEVLSAEENSKLKSARATSAGYFAKENTIDGVSYSKIPGLLTYMKQRDYDVLWSGWLQYHDDAAAELKEPYVKIVELTKKSAQINGYKDLADKWLKDEFNDTTMEKYMEKLLKDIFPLFTKLHAYVRSKLFEFYKRKIPEDHKAVIGKTIPAHILGDMWAQQWTHIGDIVVPYKHANPINITKALIDHKYDTMKLFKLAESFFTSMGLDPMSERFWDKSRLDTTGKLTCTATARDFKAKGDYRITMCTKMDDYNYHAVHHEMGHVQHFMLYSDQPYIWRQLGAVSFSEALGDTISLSARSRKHLETVGLIEKSDGKDSEVANKERMNDLMQRALHQIAFLSFMYTVEKWRFAVFRGEITPDEYNKKWWEFRVKYQEISSPVARPDDGFDIGSKYHIPNQFPFIRYFYSFIGQFQFHEALCKAAGQEEELVNCDIYQSTAAGQKLRDFMSPGTSKPWRELMKGLTGVENFQSTAIASYFKPLDEWLTEYLSDNDIEVGWEGMWDMTLEY